MDANMIGLVSAVASAVAAVAAWAIARDALKVSQASLFAQILGQYAEQQMGADLGRPSCVLRQ